MAALSLSGWNWFAAKTRPASARASGAGAADRLAAFEAMVTSDWERFHRYALRLCAGSLHDAEDLLSESMLDAFRAFDSYRGEGFDRWFFRMITNNRIDMARRATLRRAESLDSAWGEADGSAHGREFAGEPHTQPEQRLLAPLYSEPVQNALDTLSEEFRATVLLCDVEGFDYHEVADMLDIPIGTVRSRIHRARCHLRRSLEAQGWKPGI